MAWVRRAVLQRDAASRTLLGYGVPSARRINACRICTYIPQLLCEVDLRLYGADGRWSCTPHFSVRYFLGFSAFAVVPKGNALGRKDQSGMGRITRLPYS